MTRQRSMGVLFGLLAFVLLGLVALTSTSSGTSLLGIDGWTSGAPGIEDELRSETIDRLADLGINDATVQAEGRDVTVSLGTALDGSTDLGELTDSLLATKGIRTVSLDAPTASIEPAPEPEPEVAVDPTPEPIVVETVVAGETDASILIDEGAVTLGGTVLSNEHRQDLFGSTLQVDGVVTVSDELVVIDAVPVVPGADDRVGAAALVVGLLDGTTTSEVTLRGESMTVTTSAPDAASAASLEDRIAAIAEDAGLNVDTDIAFAEGPSVAEVVDDLDLSGVNFELGTAVLTSEAQGILDGVAAQLSSVTDTPIEVQGHTDSTGDPDSNVLLSEFRAIAVVDYLVNAGVDPSILTAKGYGAAVPIADNGTADGQAQNRRVELIVAEGN